MSKTNLVALVLEQYKNGQRYFSDLDIEDESFEGQNLEGIVFENCLLYARFCGANLRNAKFINGAIKTCDFRKSDLTNAHFEHLSVESAEFAGSITTGVYFNNNWSYGQAVTQADFEDWIKDYPKNQYADELKRIKTFLLQLDQYLENGNYEPHFSFNLISHSTHLNEIVPELNKLRGKHLVTRSNLKEISFHEFKREVSEKINFDGNPGPNQALEAQQVIQFIEKGFWQLIEQKFNPNFTKFYLCPHTDRWIFWSFSFLIVSNERNKSYLFEGGASD